jgi:hypothetical protein
VKDDVRVDKTLAANEIIDSVAEKECCRIGNGKTPAKWVRAERHCWRCGETGHNSRTCKVEMADTDGSVASQQQGSTLQAALNRDGLA